MATGHQSEGTDMTIEMTQFDTLGQVGFGYGAGYASGRRLPTEIPARPVRRHPGAQRKKSARRPGPGRAAGSPLAYRGTGVLMSRASHRRRPITPFTTVALALLAALITVWLGLVAQFGEAVHGVSAPVPGKLAVVQVQMGETLQQVAARVAPDAPVGPVIERIRELNKLDSVAVDAGQTLIAPVG
jgi:LysM domain